jgi:plasmid stability protein
MNARPARLSPVQRVFWRLLLGLCMVSQTLSAADDLTSSDYRVRMSAALVLGRSTEPGARKTLEIALSDGHPAVRAAAAASLAKVGDAKSQNVLRARAETESDDSVKKQIARAVDMIESRKEKKQLMVQLGTFRNASKTGGTNLTNVASSAARSNAIKFAQVVDAADVAATAAGPKKSHVVRLDGELRSLSLTKQGDVMSVRAQVEFSILQMPGKTLKGTLSGAATSRDAGVTVASLQELAVRGAVESALANAGPSLIAASE